ncbi:MAG: hypothetical protein BSOLF_1871 [Candidatus Carbobacillus altaicus]|uniref:Uncharacterized protein n=1 Tax=Candidatus Carbonibacillus altaicus TaxID=2163959 RepID=A0A2R6Y3Q9_9BACL|nr:MAG: hypothetical protein BSOLF_1871 [Candidatus Carbobacillus altaicus]
MDQMEENDMFPAVKPINKEGKTGLTKKKKELMKRYQGSASIPVDLNKIYQWAKHHKPH